MIEVCTPTHIARILTALAVSVCDARRDGADPVRCAAKLAAYGEVAIAFGLPRRQIEVLARAELEAGDG